jgi:hypothetical protein
MNVLLFTRRRGGGTTMRRFLTAAALGLLAMAGRVDAALINYTETVVASGSLGGTSFTDATLIIDAMANTTDVVEAGRGSYYVDGLSVSFTLNLAGGGGDAGTFTSPGKAFVTQADQTFGIQLPTTTLAEDVLVVQSPDLGGFDMKTEIGPLTGTAIITPGQAFATSFGDLILTSTSGDATFRANFVGAAVPEPSSLVLGGLGGLATALGLARRRNERG